MRILAIQAGQVSVPDMILFLMLSAYFRSMGTGDATATYHGVDAEMTKVTGYAAGENPALAEFTEPDRWPPP